jgi:hypothetical protein
MQCPRCKTQMVIKDTHYQTVNDDTPDLPTEVYLIQEFVCHNPNCPDKEKIGGENKVKII